MKWQEIIKDSAWVVDDLLTPIECEQFVNKAMEEGIQNKISKGDKRHRNSTTVAIDDIDMADRIFDRIKDFIPKEIIIDEHYTNEGLTSYNKKQLFGKWNACGINSKWRVVCYPGTGHFGPHRDGARIVDENHRSLITINGYLTDRPLGYGGATRFVKDSIDTNLNEDGLFTTPEEDVLHRIEADKAGKAVVFFHDLMHDGEPLQEGSPEKWLFRSEIIFERDPETAPQLTIEEKEARELLKRAEVAEEECNILEAIHLYKKAYKLDPTLDCSNN
jgi:hypothetical protein